MPSAYNVDSENQCTQLGGQLLLTTLSATGSSTSIVLRGNYNVVLSGTWVGTVTIDCAYPDDPTTWNIVASFTANTVTTGFEPQYNVLYRATFTRTSGSVVVRLCQ
jgi:hypothetical protein